METLQYNSKVEKHYYRHELFNDILDRVKEQENDLDNVSRNVISGVDEFHLRGAEVSRELAREVDLSGAKVLDIGCGIGGPCRMLADEFNCEVTGIDLSHEYIKTAEKLSELVGLKNKIKFIQADALDLPSENESFDVVWTQHAQMNISDKNKFYSEIKRVLKDKGIFIYHDIFKKNNGDINFPVPWANDKSVSFLETTAAVEGILEDLGFTKVKTIDQTDETIQFLNNIFEKIKKNGPPKLGLNILMGASTKEKLGNILHGIEENKLVVQSGIYKR